MVVIDSKGEMVVDGLQTIRAKVKIDERQQLEIAIEVIKKQFGLSNSRHYHHFLGADNKLMLREVYSAGSHEHERNTEVRISTAEDRAALLLMGILEKRMFGG